MKLSMNDMLHRIFVGALRRFADGNAVIRSAVERGGPCMVARFGAGESQATVYPLLPWPLRRAVRRRCIGRLHVSAGVFPGVEASMLRFSELMMRDAEEVDILGSWRIEEALLAHRLSKATFVPLTSLEPYYAIDPWSEALAGRKVLVVHPFKTTIESQYYSNRTRLFRDPRLLPEFGSLTVLQAVQSIAGSPTHFRDWFAALDWMKSQIDRIEFDVALIGCGAYGFPLAAHVKRMGRVGIHLGGATQVLFGIRGRRWEAHPVVGLHINEHWVRPSAEETPARADLIENACYW
jgi:hypothetical protein